jgi:hypothetical protein
MHRICNIFPFRKCETGGAGPVTILLKLPARYAVARHEPNKEQSTVAIQTCQVDTNSRLRRLRCLISTVMFDFVIGSLQAKLHEMPLLFAALATIVYWTVLYYYHGQTHKVNISFLGYSSLRLIVTKYSLNIFLL